MINQDDILITLSYLLGERTVPTTGVESRRNFIQSSLEEAYRAYNWRFATQMATLSITNGSTVLPNDLDLSHELSVTDLTTNVELEELAALDNIYAIDGSKQFWITANSDNTFSLNTRDSATSNINVIYQTTAPAINSTIATPYPNKNTIALGARRYVKLSQNPDADISSDETLFQKRLGEDIAAMQVPSPRRRRHSAQSRGSYHTGDF